MNIKKHFFHKVTNLRHFIVLSLCRLLKYNLEHTMTIIKGDKIIIETLIYHNNKLVGEYTFI
jgi:hypothetical protein